MTRERDSRPIGAMFIGYARLTPGAVPSDEQAAQLRAAGCVAVFEESDHKERPGLAQALHACGFGDVLVVTRVDRLAWTLRELFEVVAKLLERGAGLRSLSEAWADPLDDRGRHTLTLLKGLAEFENAAIADRMATIRHDARMGGKALGQPPALTPEQVEEARRLYAPGDGRKGLKMQEIAERMNVNRSTISRAINPKPRKIT